jgi:hypothetical protein
LKQYEVEYTTIESFLSTRRELRNPNRRGSHQISGSKRIQSALFVVIGKKKNRTRGR